MVIVVAKKCFCKSLTIENVENNASRCLAVSMLVPKCQEKTFFVNVVIFVFALLLMHY